MGNLMGGGSKKKGGFLVPLFFDLMGPHIAAHGGQLGSPPQRHFLREDSHSNCVGIAGFRIDMQMQFCYFLNKKGHEIEREKG